MWWEAEERSSFRFKSRKNYQSDVRPRISPLAVRVNSAEYSSWYSQQDTLRMSRDFFAREKTRKNPIIMLRKWFQFSCGVSKSFSNSNLFDFAFHHLNDWEHPKSGAQGVEMEEGNLQWFICLHHRTEAYPRTLPTFPNFFIEFVVIYWAPSQSAFSSIVSNSPISDFQSPSLMPLS